MMPQYNDDSNLRFLISQLTFFVRVFVLVVGKCPHKIWCCSWSNGWESRQLCIGHPIFCWPSSLSLSLWSAESFSNRQRPDKKQDCCPLGRQESRVKDRRAVFNTVRSNWDSLGPQPQQWTPGCVKPPVSVMISVHLHLCGQILLSVVLLVRYESYYWSWFSVGSQRERPHCQKKAKEIHNTSTHTVP